MRGREPKYTVPERTIIGMREQGYSCREIAERWGIPEHRVWYVMQRTGNSGRYHAAAKRDGHTSGRGRAQKQRREHKLEELVEQYDVVTIEAGTNGGYVATLDDEWTGEERQGITAALTSAAKEAEHAND